MTTYSDALDDQVALVTGASSGIGEATSELLADEGAQVALAARREDELHDLADQIESMGSDAFVVPTDITEEEQVQAMLNDTVDEFGRLDMLINSAGVMLPEPAEDADTDNWRQMIDVNLLGVMYATRAAIPIMQKQGNGHIVNVSSIAGRKASLNTSGYNATKFGLNGFTKSVRKEVTQDEIRTTLIEPGVVDTELQEHIPDPEMKEEAQKWVKSIEALTAGDIARSIRYAVTQPTHVSVNELLIRPTQQQ